VIATEDAAGVCALVPDPDAPGRRAQLEAALRGTPAALGPTGPVAAASLSAGRARSALGLEAGEGLVVADEHRLELLLAADRPLARDLAAARLAPLAGETDASRSRLRATLAAWLDHQGRTERVAAALHVHPQTVRYRVARLRDLFGDDLDDPAARRELSIALAVPN
jgi:DNA-binding PucR family transcriptional regulator